ncbi:hypothetical protein MA16_Dca009056 [Dendrobium catenatum]|uniref:Uncharacterized protein n=1 Tax=Dendrobium catenatum TaxID=906689 RepID=A0A2I0VRF0_9ASPA|nr:hypothetical protein MA16_Dca009056 [Dendrobium catenatum]
MILANIPMVSSLDVAFTVVFFLPLIGSSMEYSMGIAICVANVLKWDPVPYKVMVVMVFFFDVQRLFVERWNFLEASIVPVGDVAMVISSTFKGVEVLFLADLFSYAIVYTIIWLPLIGVSMDDSLDLHRLFDVDLKWDLVPSMVMVVAILFCDV